MIHSRVQERCRVHELTRLKKARRAQMSVARLVLEEKTVGQVLSLWLMDRRTVREMQMMVYLSGARPKDLV